MFLMKLAAGAASDLLLGWLGLFTENLFERALILTGEAAQTVESQHVFPAQP